MVELILDDGEKTEVAQGTAFSEILEKLNEEFIQKAVAVKVNGRVFDIRQKVTEGGNFKVLTIGATEALGILRHSTSHLMALAVQQLFENVKFAIGPAIEDGFYYDFLLDRTFTPDDLERIEEKMRELQKSNELEFTREDMPKQKAIELFTEHDQPFKVELINELDNDTVSVYRLGSFIDLCAGPHLSDIKMAHAFKLLSIAGAYWRGDEQREMLQRVYGTAFFEEADLENELERREEAKRRDHRRLGPSLELFDTKEEAGGGLVFWYPKGYVLREIIENYWKKEHRKEGYEIVLTPHIAKSDLWKRSGHYDYYHENMYIIRDEEQEFVLKPMNCPAHILIYKSKLRSYRDLPIRYAELGTVYRKERSGTLHGLLRVRGFTQDDAHIICTSEQLVEEIDKVLVFSMDILKAFGFKDFLIYLSTMPEKAVGKKEDWDRGIEALRKSLDNHKIEYEIDEGAGAFYGPKIDIYIKDALNRSWQCSTIQFDFNLPEQFGM
ncbi:MAG: threonine--tRNA ligase, partial [Candidatus Krumholzibacteria bacterium]|nr:threonine--tRNA ligase [Candidatus Krumholzibacteria bacterium]